MRAILHRCGTVDPQSTNNNWHTIDKPGFREISDVKGILELDRTQAVEIATIYPLSLEMALRSGASLSLYK